MMVLLFESETKTRASHADQILRKETGRIGYAAQRLS